MDMGQGIRRIGLRARKTGTWLTRGLKWRPSSKNLKLSVPVAGVGIALVALFYIAGAFFINTVDTNLDFKPSASRPGESKAVAIATALIDREVDRYGWTSNDPFSNPPSCSTICLIFSKA